MARIIKQYEQKIGGKLYVLGKSCLCVGSAQYSLGTPETSRRGRSTRKARRALTSNPPPGFPA